MMFFSIICQCSRMMVNVLMNISPCCLSALIGTFSWLFFKGPSWSWYSYESEFLQKLVKDKTIHEARAFNFTYKYIGDVLSINNSRFAEFLPLIYPPELEVRDHRYSFVRIIFGLIFRLCRKVYKRCIFILWKCIKIKKSRKMSKILFYQYVT